MLVGTSSVNKTIKYNYEYYHSGINSVEFRGYEVRRDNSHKIRYVGLWLENKALWRVSRSAICWQTTAFRTESSHLDPILVAGAIWFGTKEVNKQVLRRCLPLYKQTNSQNNTVNGSKLECLTLAHDVAIFIHGLNLWY